MGILRQVPEPCLRRLSLSELNHTLVPLNPFEDSDDFRQRAVAEYLVQGLMSLDFDEQQVP